MRGRVPEFVLKLGYIVGKAAVGREFYAPQRAEAFRCQAHWIALEEWDQSGVEEHRDALMISYTRLIVSALRPAKSHPAEEHASDSSIFSRSSRVDSQFDYKGLAPPCFFLPDTFGFRVQLDIHLIVPLCLIPVYL